MGIERPLGEFGASPLVAEVLSKSLRFAGV